MGHLLKYFLLILLASTNAKGICPQTFSISAKCSNSSCVANSRSPVYISPRMQAADHMSEG